MKDINYILKKFYRINCAFVDEYEDRYFIYDDSNNNYYLYDMVDTKYFNYIYDLSLINNNYKFIYNIFNKIITKYNGCNYVLIKIDDYMFFDKNNLFFYSLNKFIKLKWKNNWVFKVTYIEKIYLKNKGVYSLIDDSIDFYISMAEFAIFYLFDYDDYVGEAFIQHTRVNDEYSNPFNLIIDVKERDFAEYLKYIFFNYSYEKIDIKNLFNNKINYNYNLVISRLFFPNYYFDLFEDIVEGRISQFEIKEIIYRMSEFLDYTKQIINEIQKISSIKKIPFKY